MPADGSPIAHVDPAASPEEAAAIAAAIDRFLADHAPAPDHDGAATPASAWLRTARVEAVDREPRDLPWGNAPAR